MNLPVEIKALSADEFTKLRSLVDEETTVDKDEGTQLEMEFMLDRLMDTLRRGEMIESSDIYDEMVKYCGKTLDSHLVLEDVLNSCTMFGRLEDAIKNCLSKLKPSHPPSDPCLNSISTPTQPSESPQRFEVQIYDGESRFQTLEGILAANSSPTLADASPRIS